MKFKFEIGDLIKIPNILCYLRIIMVPLFVYMYFTSNEPIDYIMAAVIVLLSGITDFLDGQIARRCNMITDLGKIIDPVADKLMQLTMIVALSIRFRYFYILMLYLIIKEVTMFLFAAFIYKKYKKRLNGAKWYGKVCTAVLYVLMLVLIALPNLNEYVRATMLVVCFGFLTLSFVMYVRLYFIMIRDKKEGNLEQSLY